MSRQEIMMLVYGIRFDLSNAILRHTDAEISNTVRPRTHHRAEIDIGTGCEKLRMELREIWYESGQSRR